MSREHDYQADGNGQIVIPTAACGVIKMGKERSLLWNQRATCDFDIAGHRKSFNFVTRHE